MHPSVQNLYNLLRRARAEDLPPGTRRILENISEDCQECHQNAPRPLSFKIRDANNLQFNHELLLDIMYLHEGAPKQHPVLQIVDARTRFSAAAFLLALHPGTVWNTFVKAWSSLYVGFPDSMLTDQGPVFVSAEWNDACRTSATTLRHTGTQSHNSLGAGEKYHDTLRIIYHIVLHDYESLLVDIRWFLASTVLLCQVS